MKRRATLRDIARKAGVSAVTAHKAIYSKQGVGEDTRARILEIARSMDYSVNEAASSLKRRALHIAVILQSLKNPQNFFFRKMWEGIDRAENALSDYRVRITRVECGDNWESQEEILCNLARRKDVDGVILHCWDETKLNPAIDYLRSKSIPVVTANSDAIGSQRVGCVSAPNDRIGRLAAEILGRFMPVGGRALVVGGNQKVENLKANRIGFQTYLRVSSPGTVVTEIYNFGDKDRFQVDFAEALRTDENITGIYAITSRDTYNACRVIREMGLSGKIRLVGSDAFSELVPYFEDDTLHATIWKDEQSQAERAVLLLCQYLSDRPLTVEPIRIGVVMRNNLEDYL